MKQYLEVESLAKFTESNDVRQYHIAHGVRMNLLRDIVTQQGSYEYLEIGHEQTFPHAPFWIKMNSISLP